MIRIYVLVERCFLGREFWFNDSFPAQAKHKPQPEEERDKKYEQREEKHQDKKERADCLPERNHSLTRLITGSINHKDHKENQDR